MNRRSFLTGLVIGAISMGIIGQWAFATASKNPAPSTCIPALSVAEYIHNVIQADRTFYTTDVVERMQMRGIAFAAENWRETSQLPLPAQFLLEAGLRLGTQQSGLHYRLISNWSINKKNSPATDFERMGLTEILVNPDRPYAAATRENGVRVFQALSADRAVSQSFVGCHNAHPSSPKKDFKPMDVMGGILLTIPLPK